MFSTVKTLLVVSLILSAFLGGFALHHHLMPCGDQTIGQQIDHLLTSGQRASAP